MSTCDQLDLQTLGSQPISMPKNLPITEPQEGDVVGLKERNWCVRAYLANMPFGGYHFWLI